MTDIDDILREARKLEATKPRPCPFCWRSDKLSLQYFPGCKDIRTVYCDSCGAWGPAGSDDDSVAIDIWNRRTCDVLAEIARQQVDCPPKFLTVPSEDELA